MKRTSVPPHHASGASRWTAVLVLAMGLAACATQTGEPEAANRPPPRDVTPSARPAAETPTPTPPQASASGSSLGLGGTSASAGAAPSGAAAAPASAPATEPPVSIAMDPGLYRCELNRRVVVRRIAPDRQSLVINWAGKDATLKAVEARTGALRFENVAAGLVWIAIVGKSMLLDSKAGRTLANECKL